MQGDIEERVSWYVHGATISPFTKGVTRASALVSPLRVTDSAQLTSCMGRFAHPKQIMTSTEHCVVMSWWCKGFQLMTFMSVLKGHKRKTHERVGVPCFKLQAHRAKFNFIKSTSVHPSTGLGRNFYIQVEIMCLVPCFMMVMKIYVTGHQFSSIIYAWVTTKLMCPATKTRELNKKDPPYLVSANVGLWIWIREYHIPSACDIYMY